MDNLIDDASARGVEILDCTFRDGGYYTSWDFPHSVVQEYLYAMSDAGIRTVELGFRLQQSEGYKGATAFTKDAYIESLSIPSGMRIGVMINASELSGKVSPQEFLDEAFSDSTQSSVSFVRIASQASELDAASIAASYLKELGYSVAINIMQFTEISVAELVLAIGKMIKESVDVVYIADSLGRALPPDVERYIAAIGDVWAGPIGFHGHDNRGFALANSHAAVHTGASWIDGTVSGIGRGAGNTRSELLLGLFDHEIPTPKMTARMERLSKNYFEELQVKKKWGPNIHYARAASKGIHPTFVQELLNNSAYSPFEISAAIDQLGATGSARFEPSQLENIDSWLNEANSPRSAWNQAELFNGKEVLFLGGGDSLIEHETSLKRLAKSKNLVVLAANLGSNFSHESIDFHVGCNPLRLIADSPEYVRRHSTLIAPRELIPPEYLRALQHGGGLLDIGLSIGEDKLGGEQGIIFLPRPNVLAFGLLVALAGNASSVYLAGFDGYSEGDPRRKTEQTLLDRILGLSFTSKVEAVTPTSLNLPLTSLYAL